MSHHDFLHASTERVAIIRRNGLGDLVCALPLIRYCQRVAPRATLSLFVEQRNAVLLPYLSLAVNAVVLPRTGNKYYRTLKTAWKERAKPYDVAISAKAGPMKLNNFFLAMLKATHKVAFVDNSWHCRFINRQVFFDSDKCLEEHQALTILQVVRPDFVEIPQDLYPQLVVPLAKREEHGHLLTEIERAREKGLPILLTSVSNNRPTSQLNGELQATILNELAGKYPFHLIISAEASDRGKAAQLAAKVRMPHTIMVTASFDAFMVVLNAIDLAFIGDGGTMHLAAGLGKKVVALFGGISISQWAPLGRCVSCLYHPNDVKLIAPREILTVLTRTMEENLQCFV